MSQNRLEARDRLHAGHDYEINLKEEIEIRKLHEDGPSLDASMATFDGYSAAASGSEISQISLKNEKSEVG